MRVGQLIRGGSRWTLPAMADDRYQVAVGPPEGPHWRSTDPMTATEVLAKLSQLGCHSTDISDPMYAAEPGWTLECNCAPHRVQSPYSGAWHPCRCPREGDHVGGLEAP
jgi:hypothetical protein